MIDAYDRLVGIRRQQRCEITRLKGLTDDRYASGFVLVAALVIDLANRGKRTCVLAKVLKRLNERANFGVA